MKIKDVCFIAVSGVSVVLGVLNLVREHKLNKKLDGITKAIDDISDDVDLTVPENIVDVAMKRAANTACDEMAKKASKKVEKNIYYQVKDILDKSYKNIEEDLKKQLEQRISVVNIDNIEESVVEKVSAHVLKRVFSQPQPIRSAENPSDIIRACAQAGMTGDQISNVVSAINK